MIMKMNYCQFWSSFMFNIVKDIRKLGTQNNQYQGHPRKFTHCFTIFNIFYKFENISNLSDDSSRVKRNVVVWSVDPVWH